MSSWSFDDTIAAIATARGHSAIAVIRISGSRTREVLSAVAPAGEVGRMAPRTAKLLTISHPLSRDNIDRALVTWFRGPGSYTGEDAAEISTHGGPLVPALTLEALIAAGAREALPGEFTRRALLNGKLDLLEAEAVLDLIEGTSPALHRNAIHQLEGGLSERVNGIRSGIVELAALVSYGIDFPDEDEPPVPTERVIARAEEWLRSVEGLLETAPQGELLREGALVVLAGRPNSGKSSLFNALCGRDRALVTDVPGTTRDAIEVMIPIDGFPFKLVDTAGLRETEDAVESLGIEVARRYVAGADVVLFCVESGRQLGEAESSFVSSVSQPVVLVRTKADLDAGELSDREMRVSVRSGEGLDKLRGELRALVFSGLDISPDQPVVTRERHVRALETAATEIRSFIELLRDEAPVEVAAVHLSGATDQLEQLVGRVDQDDILDALFASFCVGK